MKYLEKILFVGLFFCMCVAYGDILKIVHLVDPVLPNETVLLMGGFFSKNAKVEISPVNKNKWVGTDILQRSDSSLKFVMPNKLPFGIYKVRVSDNGRYSKARNLNAPRYQWCQGNLGLDATPGGYVRVFGLNMNFKDYDESIKNTPPSKVKLKNIKTGNEIILPCKVVSSFSLKVDLPKDLAEGQYDILVNNGYDTSFYRGADEKLTVKKLNWPTTVFNAQKLGGVEKALEAAKKNGGGIVYLPKGTYHIKHLYPWVVPDKTIIRGDGKDKTFVLYKGLYEDVDDALIAGSSFALENMSIRVYRNFNKVFYVDKTKAFWAKNMAFIAVCMSDRIHSVKGDVAYRGRRVWVSLDKPRYVFDLNMGSNIVFHNCSFVAPFTRGIFAARVNGLISQDNDVHIRFLPMLANFSSRNGTVARRIIHENCNFIFQVPSGDKFYMGKCSTFGDFASTDRDGMTTDLSVLAYSGLVEKVNGNKLILKSAFREKNLRHSKHFKKWPIVIINGRGVGQIRYATRTGKQEITLDSPFEIKPDESSLLIIQNPSMDHMYVNNEFKDSGRISFYGSSVRMLIHGNKFLRSTGISNGPGRGRQCGTCGIYDQVTNNQLLGPSPELPQKGTCYFMLQVDHGGICDAYHRYVMAQGNVFRRNKLSGSDGIIIKGKANNSIVEKNFLEDEYSGITVRYGNPVWKVDKTLFPMYTLLRNNSFKNVIIPYNGDFIKGALIIPPPKK